ncbi:MAG: hypothetical protein ACOCXT_04905 [Candidatus Dojkabacteria bacterium]
MNLQTIPTEIIEGSEVYGVGYEEWEAGRIFIASEIDKDGTILDIGCANGLLLVCLEAWSGKSLDKYGIDTNGDLIIQGKEFFPDLKNNLKIAELRSIKWIEELGLPATYDYIFWNIWDNFVISEEVLDGIEEIITTRIKPGGKLLLGFYHEDKKQNVMQAEKVRKRFANTRIVHNHGENNEVMAVLIA